MRLAARALLAGGLGFAVSFLVACGGGGSGLLSTNQAASLNSQLDQVSSALANGDCGAVANAADSLASTVSSLPGTVNGTLRANLDQGASTVRQLAMNECHQTSTAAPPAPTTTSTPTTTTAPAISSSTATAPPPTTSTSATTSTGSGTTSTGGSGGGHHDGGKDASGGTAPQDGNGKGDANDGH